MRWRRTSKNVLRRDRYRCQIVPGCAARATVADHIEASSPAMPDSLFFDPANLRAGCRGHNIARGLTEPLETPAQTTVVTEDYS